MKILWICGLPIQVQEEVLVGEDLGAHAAWSWILGHLPPPDLVDLHIACPVTRGPWKERSFEYRGAHFHLVRCLPGRLQSGFLLDPYMFLSLFHKLKPDVVHGWGTEDSYSITARFLAPESHVVQVQGLINAYLPFLEETKGIRYVALRERNILKRAGHVFVESGYSREISEPYCGRRTKIHIVDHPLRSDFLTAEPATGYEKSILFVGALCDRKGYLDAVHAFSKAHAPGWTLCMVGGGSEDETRKLTSHIADLPNITHVPHASADQIMEFMQNASVFLLPSRMDTGPTALKEALAMGLWPVCYDNSGPLEYISRFNYGALAGTGELDNLVQILQQAMAEQPWLKGDRISSVVAQVRHDLCAETIWKQLLGLYRDIADQT